MIDIYPEVEAAEARIRPFVRRTYLQASSWLSERTGCNVYLKLEHLQHTGSFKLRGALSKVLYLKRRSPDLRIVTSSTGNHGMAMAYALSLTGLQGRIYLPRGVSPAKLEKLSQLGGQFEILPTDAIGAELEARRLGDSPGHVYVSPYNDPQVIGGQGTLGIEILSQLPRVDVVLVSVGGGGLVAGIAGYLKRHRPDVRVVGCLPRNSPAMYRCIQAGKIVPVTCHPTLSDGTAGEVEPGSITYDLCRGLVDDYALVAESSIAETMRLLLEKHRLVVEGSAAVAVAALLELAPRFKDLNLVVVLCGGNVDVTTLRQIFCGFKENS